MKRKLALKKPIRQISQVKGLRDPKCGCTFEPFGFIKAVKSGEVIDEVVDNLSRPKSK